MTTDKDPVERALELIVFVPIGVGLYVKDMAPAFVDMFVARGRAEVDRRQEQVQQHVTTARSLGQVAMAFGAPMVRQRVQERVQRHVDEARGRATEFLGSRAPAAERPPEPLPPTPEPGPEPVPPFPPPAPEPPPVPDIPATATSTPPSLRPVPRVAPVPTFAPFRPTNGAQAPASDDLPIPGYDALSASQVVERLIGLSSSELDTVRAYETAHRARRTILGKIEQLTV
jgi:hypothetical protein